MRPAQSNLFALGWHLTQADSFLLRNAFLGKGFTSTMSAVAAATSNTGFVSPYQTLNVNKEKEELWEKVRQDIAPTQPSRLGAIFMFEDETAVERARQRWFKDEQRLAVRVMAFPPPVSLLHRADTEWLNYPREEWGEAAAHYWHGTVSQSPLFELVVHGQVYFPDWEHRPFGLMAPSRESH